MFYSMHFTFNPNGHQQKTGLLKNQLMDITGIKDVQSTGRGPVRVNYDPAKIVPGQMTKTMRGLGLNNYCG
jgi:hypothetical protein